MNEILDKDLSFTFDACGYMLYYKDKPIGGAGTKERGRKLASNIEFYRGQAQLTMNMISQGRGPHHIMEAIKTIDKVT